jgi:hypothetical protein
VFYDSSEGPLILELECSVFTICRPRIDKLLNSNINKIQANISGTSKAHTVSIPIYQISLFHNQGLKTCKSFKIQIQIASMMTVIFSYILDM